MIEKKRNYRMTIQRCQYWKKNNLELTGETSKFVLQCEPNGFVGFGETGVRRFERDHIIRYGRYADEHHSHERARKI